jgi:hypothetical protein
MRRLSLVGLGLAMTLALGCASPESTRTRGGGPGADVGNRGQVVRLHEGSGPFHDTPRLVPHGLADLEPARQAQQLSQRR